MFRQGRTNAPLLLWPALAGGWQGKTVQAIAVASCYRDEWPLLIIAPSSLRGKWCTCMRLEAGAAHQWNQLWRLQAGAA